MPTKLQLFNDFSKSLEVVAGLKDSYACPLCLARIIPRASLGKLTKEHYVPESLAGSKLVLLCGACNQGLGRTVDPQLKKYARREEFQNRYPESRPMILKQKGRRVRVAAKGLTVDGEKLSVRVEDSITLVGRDEISQKEAIEGWTAFLDKTMKNGTWPGTHFQLQDDRDLKYDMRVVGVGLLRTAYLAAFASLGYGYIIAPPLDKVRAQVLNPRRKLLNHFPNLGPKRTTDPCIVFHYVREPVELSSILVQFDGFEFPHEWSVFLPLPFDKDLKIYENLCMLRGKPKELRTLIFEPNTATKHERSLILVDDGGKEYPIY